MPSPPRSLRSRSSSDKHWQSGSRKFVHCQTEALEPTFSYRITAGKEPDMRGSKESPDLGFGEMPRELHYILQAKCRSFFTERNATGPAANDS